MKLGNVLLWIAILFSALLPLQLFVGHTVMGRYQVGRKYDSQKVSFANECALDEYSVEKRVIYDRRRLGTYPVCIDREGSVRQIESSGVVLGRSNYDGAYKVTLLVDEAASASISKVLVRGHGEAVLYRGDTLLTRVVGSGKDFPGRLSSYHSDREEADIAMSQVAVIASQEAKQSWHR
jgi:hypothetical protein